MAVGERIGKVKGEATDKLPEYFIAKEWRIIMYPIFNIAGIENHEILREIMQSFFCLLNLQIMRQTVL